MAHNREVIFDQASTRSMISKGRRGKWMERKGGRSSGFRYLDCNGKLIRDQATLERIEGLVIPPAWKHVRICPSPGGRLQVVGMDTRGRIQYRYHPSFVRKQARRKFAKVEKFGRSLPQLRSVTNDHLALPGLPKQKVLAATLRLINSLYFRVGTDLSEKTYKTYGITTLKKKHLSIRRNGTLVFDFVGKSHVQHRKVLVDNDLAAVIKEIASLPGGRKLFRFVGDDGRSRSIKPADVNSYIKSIAGSDFSSKDFRTWGGTLLAAIALSGLRAAETEAELKKNVVKAVKQVAVELGNTPAVCRSSYIHPAVLDEYAAGRTIDHFTTDHSRRIKRSQSDLEPEEEALLRLLKRST